MKQVLIGVCAAFCTAVSAGAEPLHFVTEELAPYNFTDESSNQLVGIGTDMLRLTVDQAKLTAQFEVMAWNRAYSEGQTKQGTCVYSTVRLPEREKLFRWIGPLVSDAFVLFGRKNQHYDLTKPSQLANYTVGTILNDAPGKLAESQGARLEISSDHLATVRKVLAGRTDLWASGILPGNWLLKNEKIDGLVKVLELQRLDLYLACQPLTDDTTVKRLQSALDYIKDKGLTNSVYQRYR